VAIHDLRGKRDARSSPKLDDCFSDETRIVQIIGVGTMEFRAFFRLRVWPRVGSITVDAPKDCSVWADAALRAFAKMDVMLGPPEIGPLA
jgi:hypothetical protein